jgi:hypothetical protein
LYGRRICCGVLYVYGEQNSEEEEGKQAFGGRNEREGMKRKCE